MTEPLPDPVPAMAVDRRFDHVMGMPISLALRGLHAHDHFAEHAWQQALESLREADRIFSTYRADSAISRLASGELLLQDCPPVVAEVLELGDRARAESGGAFDVRRRDPGGQVVLDPSGVVKGWAVQRAAASLSRLKRTDFCLSAGGDMLCRTAAPGSPGWRIGIEDPFDPTKVVAVVPVRDGAIATSGLAARGAHITDPRTDRTPDYFASVTVVAADLTWADIDATAAFVLGPDAPAWLASRPGRSGVLVRTDGTAEAFAPHAAGQGARQR
ncbi:MAG: ApbE family protein [Marmoricola sp.]|nr:ApbE family protein [Marmoricola sp.]